MCFLPTGPHYVLWENLLMQHISLPWAEKERLACFPQSRQVIHRTVISNWYLKNWEKSNPFVAPSHSFSPFSFPIKEGLKAFLSMKKTLKTTAQTLDSSLNHKFSITLLLYINQNTGVTYSCYVPPGGSSAALLRPVNEHCSAALQGQK